MIAQPYPTKDSRKEIVFIRHAESQANRDRIWNGSSDGPLSEAGEASLDHLGRRLSAWHFDSVISSPLERARRTAESFSRQVEIDESFIEMNLGEWEGMAFDEVEERHGEELREALKTRNMPLGRTGESLEDVGQRALAAVDDLYEKMSDGQRVAVVTHGGFLQSVLSRHMAGRDRRPHAFSANTGITRIVEQFGRPRLATFNDTSHLGPRSTHVSRHLGSGNRVLTLVRHGRTKANVEGRWQGHGDWGLDEVGERQAAALAEWYGKHPVVYASPLKRAASTAALLALNGVVEIDELKEIHMGDWEGMTTSEISERWPDVLDTIYRDGNDLPRGGTGETWRQLTDRIAGAIDTLTHPEDEVPTVVVAHGGAIRAFVSSLTDTEDTHSESLFTPANTSVSHIAMTEAGPEILDYSVAPHLETLA